MAVNDWMPFLEKAAVLAPACFFHAKIVLSSRNSKIRNADVLGLLSAWVFFAVYWAYRNGAFSVHAVAVNSAFLFLATLGTLKFSSPAYAKYVFASGIPFVLSASVARFAVLCILTVFVVQSLSAVVFYVRTSVSWGLFGFLRKHFSESAASSSGFAISSALRHVLAFAVMVIAVRLTQSLLASDFALPHLGLSAEEFSFTLTAAALVVSWSVFSLKDRMLSRNGAIAGFALVFAVMAYAVYEMGPFQAVAVFAQALVMYVLVWGIRSALSFHSACDWARFVPYDEVRPGDLVDKKFLFRFLADFQYGETRAKEIVDSASGSVTREWIASLREHVLAATRSASERALPGFVARTEILVLRKTSLAPQIALAAIACLVSFPNSPAQFFFW